MNVQLSLKHQAKSIMEISENISAQVSLRLFLDNQKYTGRVGKKYDDRNLKIRTLLAHKIDLCQGECIKKLVSDICDASSSLI